MVKRVVAFSLDNPLVVLAAAAALVGGGFWAYRNLDIEAYPDPVPPRIETLAQPSGWAAEEVERYATVPLEVALNGMPGLDHIRSISVFGLSDVKCYFRWGTDYRDDRQEVLNRLVTVQLPNNLQPVLSPENAIGEIYRYIVTGRGYSPLERKTAQDWILERQFKQVDGVVDVAGFGGLVQQYQVDVDPYRLRGHGLSLSPLLSVARRLEPERRRQRPQPGRAVVQRPRHRPDPRPRRHRRRRRVALAAGRPCGSATSRTWRSATRRGSASWGATPTTTSCRASCS